MKKIFISMLALFAIATTAGAQTDYGFWVGGVKVNSSNASNITGSAITRGTAVYNHSTRTLTLNNVTISRSGSSTHSIENNSCSGLKIVFQGTNNFTNNGGPVLRLDVGTTIECAANSNTTLKSTGGTDRVVYLQTGNLTIQGTGALTIDGSDNSRINGIEGKTGSEFLTFDGPTVTINALGCNLYDLGTIFFKGTGRTILKSSTSTNYMMQIVRKVELQGYQHVFSPWNSAHFVAILTYPHTTDYYSLYDCNGTGRDNAVQKGEVEISNRCNIIVKVGGEGGGTVTGGGIYEGGDRVTLKATPMSGYRFVEWKAISTQNNSWEFKTEHLSTVENFNFNAVGNREITAVFEKLPTGIEINATNFPDLNFRSFVSGTTIDKDGNGFLSTEEIAAVTEINVFQKNISDLTGIHHFTKLKTLNCTENKLTKLDVSKNTELTTLYCSINQLSALDVSKNQKLTTLYCYYNQIGKDAMQTLVDDLPTVSDREFRAINMDGINNGKEKNFISPEQVKAAKDKGWNVWGKCDVDGTFKWQEFAGAVAITATANPAEGGTVTGAGTYEAGKTVTLTAKPNKGYKFKHWTYVYNGKKYTDTGNPFVLPNITADWTLTAYFEKDETTEKTLSVTFTKAVTPVSELDAQDRLALSAVTTLVEKEKLDGYSLVVDSRRGTTTLKKGTKTLFVVATTNGTITVPSGVSSADNINVELDRDLIRVLSQALGTTEGQILSGFDAIQVKFDIDTTTGLTAVESGQLTVDSWYTIDGVKLQGEPTKKGVYIYKGKKVVKK